MKTLATIHPDYLLERSRRGELPPDDRRRLAAHLAGCSVCAWEQAAADDFSREQGALDPNPARLGVLVDGVLARAALAGAPPRRETSKPRGFGRKIAAVAMIAAAAVAVLLPGARAAREGVRDTASIASQALREAPLASTEAGLDAGAIGAPSGGDS
jgi:anti-sigma factor RsiW